MRHTLHAGKDLLLLIRPILTYMPSIREPSGRSRRTVGSREQKLDFIFVLPFLVLLAHRVSFLVPFYTLCLKELAIPASPLLLMVRSLIYTHLCLFLIFLCVLRLVSSNF